MKDHIDIEIANCETILENLEDQLEPEYLASTEEQLYRLNRIKDLWDEFGDVPMDPETECIESKWHHFPAGTHREDIWHWFEHEFGLSVGDNLI